MKRLVIATGNAGKLREFRELLAPLGITVLPQSDFNVAAAEEPHCTFVENALAKARHAARITGLPALADDSGLCVDALGGAPGVQSAVYAGHPRSDARNNQKLMEAMQGVVNRAAHYHCALVLVRRPDDPEPLIAEGQWHGTLLDAPRGNGGFGYDPYFLDPEYRQTGGELPLEVKNRISHRGKALALLLEKLKQYPL
ncbi:MAG: RdgB/HAM1 family non-canonical purine NTP pyrophosphatase [Methylophilaceae bacterium]|nr:RdgB/HAM1 family non-canonical purine NTP pyrophosphatase [Methylophilaceae bacterium]